MIYRIFYLPQPSSAPHNTENSSPRGAGGGTSQEDDAPQHASQAEDARTTPMSRLLQVMV